MGEEPGRPPISFARRQSKRAAQMPDRDAENGPNGHETADSAAQYIATITHELAQIARRNGLDALGYILDMARLEADQVSKE